MKQFFSFYGIINAYNITTNANIYLYTHELQSF